MKKYIWLVIFIIIGIEQSVISSYAGGGAASSAKAKGVSRAKTAQTRQAQLKAALEQEQTPSMNLVIISDASEAQNLFTKSDPISELQNIPPLKLLSTMTGRLLLALLENQLVLCSTPVWAHIEDIVTATNYLIDAKLIPRTDTEKAYRQTLIDAMATYKKFKDGTITTLKETLSTMFEEVISTAKFDNDGLDNIDMLFHLYIAHNIIISKNYTCKKLTEDFVLFVPTNKQSFIPANFYQNFPDWDYKNNTTRLAQAHLRHQQTEFLNQRPNLGKTKKMAKEYQGATTIQKAWKQKLTQTGEKLINAIQDRNFDTVNNIAQSPMFSKIPTQYLGEALELAADKEQKPIIQLLIGNPKFKDISPKSLGLALQWASYRGNRPIVHLLINNPRFSDITDQDLNIALQESVNYPTIIKMINNAKEHQRV